MKICMLSGFYDFDFSELSEFLQNDYDILVLLGGLKAPFMEYISKLKKPIYAVRGGYEKYDFKDFNIFEITGVFLEKNGITFTGMGGVYAYKSNSNRSSMTQAKGNKIADKLPKADVFFTADKWYSKSENPLISSLGKGLKGIKKYLIKNTPTHHFYSLGLFSKQDENAQKYYKTLSINVQSGIVFDIEKDEMIKM